MDKITDEIYVGGITTKADLLEHRIKHVIDLSGLELDYDAEVIPITDDGYNDPKQILKIVKRIDQCVDEKKTPLYVSCQMGISRSVTITALYLYWKGRFGKFDDALDFVKSRRTVAMPNPDLVDFVKADVLPLLSG